MAPSTTCGVCGTVNVVATGRCIACSQPLADFDPTEALPPPVGNPGSPAAPSATSKTAPLEEGDYKAAAAQAAVHLESQDAPAAAVAAPATPAAAPAAAVWPPPEQRSPSTAEWADQPVAPAEPAAPPQAPAAPAAPPAPHGAAEPRTDDLSGSALRRTVVEPAARRLRPKTPEKAPEQRDSRDEIAPGGAGASPESSAPRGPGEPRFVLRLLLPEGDKRLVEMHEKPMRVGSGLDEVGLAGDPRIRPSEATLLVADGGLWIDVAADSSGVYRRVDGEEALSDGDVVLVGDIAARFHSLPPSSPVAEDSHVLGGAAGSACGRLVFLRRDGSAGPIHDLPQGKTILGRTDGHINFPSDSRLSRRHARFYASDSRVTVEDLDSRNGTYVRIRGRRRLSVGDALRVGSAGLQIRAPG